MKDLISGVFGFFALLAAILGFVAWLTHVVTCLQEHQWGFLIAGAVFFPVAIVHGVGLWFGFFH